MMPVAILAGGVATRLRPLTSTLPKALVEVAGKPFIERQLEQLREQGVLQIVLCVGYLGDSIERVVGNGARYGLEITYSYDGTTPLGTGGAIKKALPILGDAFFVLYGDTLLTCCYQQVENAFKTSAKPALMTVFENNGRWDTSNVVFSDGSILLYDKRNPIPEMHHIDYGLGVLTASVLMSYAEKSFDLAVLYKQLSEHGDLAGFQVEDRFYEIGSFEGLKETEAFFRGVSS